MTEDELERIRGLPIESVAERNGLNVIRRKSLCPFHDDHHASLSFKYNHYKCYSCGAHGDGISLTMHMQNLKFADACHWLANQSNIILTEYKPKEPVQMTPKPFPKDFYQFLLSHFHVLGLEAERFLYNERNLSFDVVMRQQIRAINYTGHWLLFKLRKHYTDQQLRDYGILRGEGNHEHCFFWTPCLLFPYYDIDGQLIGIQSRYVGAKMRFLTPEAQARHDEIAKRAPRFQFPQGCHPMIYNLPILKTLSPGEELWIAEGITDCLAILSSGRKCIAIPSSTLLTHVNKALLATIPTKNWHMAPDQDAPGESLYNALLSVANECGATLTRHQLPQGCKDFSDWWQNHKP